MVILTGWLILSSYFLTLLLNWNNWYSIDGQRYYVYDTDFSSLIYKIDSLVDSKSESCLYHDDENSRIIFLGKPDYLHERKWQFKNYIYELDGVLYFTLEDMDDRICVDLTDFVPSHHGKSVPYDTAKESISDVFSSPNYGRSIGKAVYVNDCRRISIKDNLWIMKYFEDNVLKRYTSKYSKSYLRGYICNLYLSLFYKFHSSIWLFYAIMLSLWFFSFFIRKFIPKSH